MLGCLYIAWGIPVVSFIYSPSYSPQAWGVWFATGVTLFIAVSNRHFFALSIPFVGMLSPLAHSSRVMGLLPSGIFLACSLIFWLLIISAKKRHAIRLLSGDRYLICMAAISFIAYLLSFEHSVLFPSLVNWIGLITIFVITRASIRTSRQIDMYFLSLLVAAGYISIIIISSYNKGMILAQFMSAEEGVYLVKENLHYLYRASFFYTNVLYLLGPAAIVSLAAVFYAGNILYKIISCGLLVTILLALFVMSAKTAWLALAFTSFLLIFLFAMNSTLEQKIGKVILSLAVIFTSPLLWYFISHGGGDISFSRFSIDSFIVRMDVFSSTLGVLSQYPERLFFGFGPDASLRLVGEATISARSHDGGTEGAIDSAIATFLFEYGLLFLVMFLLFGVHIFFRLFEVIKKNQHSMPIVVSLVGVVIFVYTASIPQVIGTSKVAWVVVQYFALVGICLSQRYDSLGYKGIWL